MPSPGAARSRVAQYEHTEEAIEPDRPRSGAAPAPFTGRLPLVARLTCATKAEKFIPSAFPRSANLTLVGLAYFGAAAAATQAFGTNTPVWFANAIALVALLQHRTSTWPVFLALVWVADFLAISLFWRRAQPN